MDLKVAHNDEDVTLLFTCINFVTMIYYICILVYIWITGTSELLVRKKYNSHSLTYYSNQPHLYKYFDTRRLTTH